MLGFAKALGACAVLAAIVVAAAAQAPPPLPRRHLLIVVDGLRPDYVTDGLMPHVSALGRRGVVFNRHHSVYPTVTRVNAASISTGAYPEQHGLLGNAVFFPKVDPTRFLDTSDRAELQRIEAAEGQLLTAPTLGEILRGAGRKMLVVSSGSAGSALLNNHTVSGGAILHPQFTLPESLGKEVHALAPPPGTGAPAGARDAWAVDAFLKVGLPQNPSVTVLWLGALDSTAHDHGIGAEGTVAVLKAVDGEIMRLEAGLRTAGLFDAYNIWITSDHGFSTYTGATGVTALLQPWTGKLADGSPRIVAAGGAIYVRDDDQGAVSQIVAALQAAPGIGAIFTKPAKPGSLLGVVPGTLSFEAARWRHDRSGQILYSPDWTDTANRHGFRGTTASGGTAGHGSVSPWDIHNTLIAAGPDLKQGVTVDTPSANLDFAPTFLRLLGITPPCSFQGRPLDEALVGRPALAAARTIEQAARTLDGTYTVTGKFSVLTVNGLAYRYLDGASVVRK